jgi:hypothetical protein
MDREDMDELLSHYGQNKVLSLQELRGEEPAFDGSFGWYI